MTVSFIIPAYNAAKYLEDCLDSVYNLDMQGHGREVIVINDGSKDNTSQLLENYRSKHSDLVVITQENEGLSMARNAGINKVSGEYIYFVDADDRLKDCSLSNVLKYMLEGIDLIGIEMSETDSKGNSHPYRRYIPKYNKVYRKAEEFMRGRNLMPCAVAYLYRRELLNAENLRFKRGIYHEDEEFMPRAFAVADSFVATDTLLYQRILRRESITTTTDKNKQQEKLLHMTDIIRSLDAMHISSMQYKLDYLAVDTLRLLLRQKHSAEFKKKITALLRETGYFPLRWHWSLKHIMFNIMTRAILH